MCSCMFVGLGEIHVCMETKSQPWVSSLRSNRSIMFLETGSFIGLGPEIHLLCLPGTVYSVSVIKHPEKGRIAFSYHAFLGHNPALRAAKAGSQM